jgi:FkbM family methyltransferase
MASLGLRACQSAASLFGWDLQKVKRAASPLANLRRLLRCHTPQLIIDCGAHEGGFGRHCRRAGYRGPILSFEPVSDIYAGLAKTAERDGGWKAIQCAIGKEEREQMMNVGGRTLSSLFAPSGKTDFKFHLDRSERVKVRRLDSIMAEMNVASDIPLLLKTDTQGSDLDVLLGAGERIAQVQSLMIEMSVQSIYDGTPSHWQILDFARENGFEPFGFYVISRDKKDRIIEYDCQFVRMSNPSH